MTARKKRRGTLSGALEDVKRIRAEAEAAGNDDMPDALDRGVEEPAKTTVPLDPDPGQLAAEENAEQMRRIREEHETSEEKDILALRERQKYYEEQRKHQKNRKPRQKVTVYMEPELREEIRTIVLQLGFLGMGISQADWCIHALTREVERMRAIYNDGEPFVRFSGKLSPGNVRKRIPND